MKTMSKILIAALLILASVYSAEAGMVTSEQAERIANNWIALKIMSTGDWGGAETATVAEVLDFKRDGRLLGYYCRIAPHGFILVSLYEGLAPTKAYSETSSLDLDPDDQSTDLLRRSMESLLDIAEENLGLLAAIPSEQLSNLVGINHSASWAMLDVNTDEFEQHMRLNKMPTDYYEGQILLSSCWNQTDPYNRYCPPANPEYCSWDHCATGCVATAAAQIIRYWSWPPEWPWMYMPDTLDGTDSWDQINATAQLNRSIGDALDLAYCNGSCATSYIPNEGDDIETFYQSWAYDSDCEVGNRDQNDALTRWGYFVHDLDRNRPIQYRMVGHQIVCDGYYNSPYPHYHMNWGHGGPKNAWYALDTLPRPEPDWSVAYDYIIHKIRPAGFLGATAIGAFPHNPEYPWRYVDRDCIGASAHFHAGNLIEFLPYVKLVCASGTVRVDGAPGLYSRLFSPVISRGIVIQDGSLVIHEGGGIKFRLSRP